MSSVWVGLAAFLLGWLTSTFSLAVLGRLAGRLRLLDPSGGRKQHAGAVPLVGGTALLITLLSGWLSIASGDGGLPPAAVAGVLACYAIGLWDDRTGKRLGAGTKAVATALVLSLVSFSLPGTSWWSVPVAFLILHCFNTSDNMNGLAGGLGLQGAVALLIVQALGRMEGVAGSDGLLLAGGLCAFLLRNYPRGQVFLGDSGSLLLGSWFAMTWLVTGHPVLLCFCAVPLADLIGVALLRLKNGAAPWLGDRRHVSHRLARSGLGEPAAVASLLLVQVCLNALGLWLTLSGSGGLATAGSLLALGLALCLALGIRERPDHPLS